MSSYDGLALTHTATVLDDGLVPGTVYKFRYLAVNAYGESDMSDEVNAGVASFPAKPNAVRKVAAESGEASITLEWDTSADTELPVLGYLVSMNDGSDVEYVQIYDGTNYPNVRKFLATGLQTGTTASFTVQAVNYNGAGEASDPADFIICLPPSQFSPPTMPGVTKTEMTLEWQSPVADGGCPVSSFYLYADDGAGGPFAEIDSADVRDLPALRSHTLTFAGTETSKAFRFYLVAENAVGSVQSDPVSFVLAAVPDKPTTRPVLNLQQTSATAIHVDYAALQESENGGSEILNYELQIYNRDTAVWQTIAGAEGQFSLLNSAVYGAGIEKGVTYQLKYRAWNINGPGEYSATGYVQAAQPPSRPAAPEYVESDFTSISLGLSPSLDDGGSIITAMVLEISPYLSTAWQAVTTYDSSTMSHVLTDTEDGLVSGEKYRFRIKAVNSFGDSAYSPELEVAAAPLPTAPERVVKVQEHSTTTAIMVQWAVPLTDSGAIIGFQLSVTDMLTGAKSLIYDGHRNPNTLAHFAQGLEPGASYGFQVRAFNFNGAGDESDIAVFKPCTISSSLAIPQIL